jgi:hypothetical protein
MALKSMTIGKNVNRRLLAFSLLMIFCGSVIASKFDSWCAIVGGAILALAGCYLNQLSVKWITEGKESKQ